MASIYDNNYKNKRKITFANDAKAINNLNNKFSQWTWLKSRKKKTEK